MLTWPASGSIPFSSVPASVIKGLHRLKGFVLPLGQCSHPPRCRKQEKLRRFVCNLDHPEFTGSPNVKIWPESDGFVVAGGDVVIEGEMQAPDADTGDDGGVHHRQHS